MENVNYNNSDALIKRLQMKNLMDGKKEEVQEQQEGNQEQQQSQATCSKNNAGSMQALDYQALMNSTLIQNSKVQNGQFKTYTLNSTGTTLNINGQNVKVTGSGKFDIAIEGNNVVIKATSNSSSIKFNNTTDLNITVEKSTKAPNKTFSLITGSGNDTVIINEGAKITTLTTNAGDDNIIIAKGATVSSINTNDGDDTVVNYGTVTGSINTAAGKDAVLNKGTVKTSINTGDGNDIIQNDGTAGNLYGANGNDQIINNGKFTNKLDGNAGTDVIIDGNTVKFEKAVNNITLGENDNAVINTDGSVTVTTKDVEANKETIVTFDKTGTEVSREEKEINVTQGATTVQSTEAAKDNGGPFGDLITTIHELLKNWDKIEMQWIDSDGSYEYIDWKGNAIRGKMDPNNKEFQKPYVVHNGDPDGEAANQILFELLQVYLDQYNQLDPFKNDWTMQEFYEMWFGNSKNIIDNNVID